MDEQSVGKAVGAYVEGVRTELVKAQAEIERLQRVVEQAVENTFLRSEGSWIIYGAVERNQGAHKEDAPDLFAHLKAKGE
jgi:hypothetical protein